MDAADLLDSSEADELRGVALISQLDRWTGEFGREYTDRNVVAWWTRVEGFRQMIPHDVKTVLEVGCNRGHNLLALSELGIGDVLGVEPMRYARDAARKTGCRVSNHSIYTVHDIGKRDLVMTSGVLIHVPPESLVLALANIHAASRKYILAIEYDGDDEAIDYRGHDDMLWKRNIGAHYTRLFPDLKLVDVGVAPAGFEEATFWLLKK